MYEAEPRTFGMGKVKFIIPLVIVAIIVFLLMELPVVTGRGANEVKKALAETEWVELSGKTLFISDLHLTAEPALEKQFNLDFSNVQNVVIVGDFFHSEEDFWSFGDTEQEVFEKVLSQIIPSDFTGKIFYINALTHDPQVLETQELSFGSSTLYLVGRYGKFTVNSFSVVAYHGDQLHGGIIGGGISWLAGKFGFPLPLERLGKKRFGIDEDTWVMNGHSHVPGIDQQARVANTGSFVGAPFNKFIFQVHVGTGILFDGDRVELQEYEGLNLKKLYPFSI